MSKVLQLRLSGLIDRLPDDKVPYQTPVLYPPGPPLYIMMGVSSANVWMWHDSELKQKFYSCRVKRKGGQPRALGCSCAAGHGVTVTL